MKRADGSSIAGVLPFNNDVPHPGRAGKAAAVLSLLARASLSWREREDRKKNLLDAIGRYRSVL